MLGVIFFVFCRLGGWIESTSADIVLTGSVVSISWRQLWSEWNETAVYLSQGPIMCVSECVCFCVYWLECVYEMYINVQDVSVSVSVCYLCFACVRYLDPSVCVGAFGMKPALLLGHRMVTWRPSFVLPVCVCVCERLLSVCVCVFVCLAGHEQCADDVKSPWVAFRRSPARSGNHPVYGPYVKTAQKRADASSEELTHRHTHSSSDTHLLYSHTH